MRILVLGTGAREHALAARLIGEPGVTDVLCAPGNAGIARSIRTAPLDVLDTAAVIRLVARERIDLTVVGPEAPLANGIVDSFQAAGLPIFGPSRAAAQLETSKAFAKDFMQRHRVPTARYRVCDSADEALQSIRGGEFGDALVVKADGLAAGKGVVVATERSMAEQAVTAAMVDHTFGAAGSRIVLEELLIGPEVSFFVVAHGEAYVPLLSAQDHKRIFDDDRGPNTGGMGAFAPSPLMAPALQSRIEREIVQPVLRGMAAEGNPFHGFLYCGLMLTADGPKVIEFNVRFGDPEAQVVLPLLEEPLIRHLKVAATPDVAPGFSRGRVAVGVVLAAHGYPGEVRTGAVIYGLDEVARDCPDVQLRFAGVKPQGDQLVTAGGRVLTVVATAPDFAVAIARAYEAASKIKFDGMQYRRDIGRRAIRP
ncbi:MAG TPA: phosphoribosylamine--glycine ligase [Vicinamibacterales bacterium]|nr:phosphoribosylamine--glycine ligase [Vicinamibacterales bacterium]